MRAFTSIALTVFLLGMLPTFASEKKVISPDTSAGNEEIDLVATIFMTEEEATKELGMDPGPDIAVLKVRVIPKTDKPVSVAVDDFILLAHNDGERSKPFTPYEIAGARRADCFEYRRSEATQTKEDIDNRRLGGDHGWRRRRRQ